MQPAGHTQFYTTLTDATVGTALARRKSVPSRGRVDIGLQRGAEFGG